MLHHVEYLGVKSEYGGWCGHLLRQPSENRSSRCKGPEAGLGVSRVAEVYGIVGDGADGARQARIQYGGFFLIVTSSIGD